ncbi:MAG: ABC transporter substrate-binding protein [Gemmatimonadota bacterium]|nr:ABC transporter substrate-binding protein [Gemmatimonadota bacterium]
MQTFLKHPPVGAARTVRPLRRSRARRAVTALFLLCTAGVAAACDGTSAAPAATTTITIGGVFSVSGNWATLGVTSKAAMEVGIDDVNQSLAAAGSGLRFAAEIIDTKLDTALTLAAVRALKAKQVDVVLGPQSSAEVAALKAFVDANGMLVISPSSTAGTLAIANDNIFRLTPSDTLEAVALVALMKADGVKTVIPFWRKDAGNVGLQVATRALFAAAGTVKAGVEYASTTTDYAASVAALKTQVQAAIAERGGTAGVAIAHAGFDEVVDIFNLTSGDPVLSAVRWYGTDGTALSEPLRSYTKAAAFAKQVNFWAPVPGVDDAASARWQPVATRIAAVAKAQPDAFALAVYDAVWLTAQAYQAAGGRSTPAALKTAFVTAAGGYYGATGWTKLNPAGDRQFGNFDFFAITQPTTAYRWDLAAQYNTQSGVLTRR